jgi:hypothetical protein
VHPTSSKEDIARAVTDHWNSVVGACSPDCMPPAGWLAGLVVKLPLWLLPGWWLLGSALSAAGWPLGTHGIWRELATIRAADAPPRLLARPLSLLLQQITEEAVLQNLLKVRGRH